MGSTRLKSAGKTTWLASLVGWCVRHYGSHSVLLSSMTKAAAVELAGENLPIPAEAIGTTHAHCYRALGCPQIAEAHLQEWNEYAKTLEMASTGCRGLDEVEEPDDTKGKADHLLEAYSMMRARMIPREKWLDRIKEFAKKWEAFKAEYGYLDFTDLIETALAEIDTAPGNPRFLMVDECQDLSKLELTLLKKWGEKAQAFILTGDPWQALFTFRGADPNLFLAMEVPEGHTQVLEQSYRVPRAVHAEAMRWIRQLSTFRELRYFPVDADGEVMLLPPSNAGGPTIKKPGPLLPYIEQAITDQKDIMLLATCGYMLNPLKHLLRTNGVPFGNKWRRTRQDWNPLRVTRGLSMADRILAYLRPSRDAWGDESRRWTGADMKAWVELIRADALARGAKASIQQLEDTHVPTFDEFSAWCGSYGTFKAWDAADLGWLEAALMDKKKDFAAYPIKIIERYGAQALRDEPLVTVGTIHSTKGAEADRVILFPDLSIRGLKEWYGTPQQKDNVVRMFYVGMTRAKETLVLCSHEDNPHIVWRPDEDTLKTKKEQEQEDAA